MRFCFHHGDRPIEGYTILRGVGRGGFSEVYFAVSDGGREVALKAIFEAPGGRAAGHRRLSQCEPPEPRLHP